MYCRKRLGYGRTLKRLDRKWHDPNTWKGKKKEAFKSVGKRLGQKDI